jgi:lysophospholipase L1-like esterase
MSIPRLLKRSAYGFFAFVVCLLALEVGVRLSGRAAALYTEPAFETSARGDYWRYRPGFEGQVLGVTRARIGPLGTRLDGGPSDAPHEPVTVAIFGDSVTFGQGVEADLTFSAQLEKSLRDADLPAEVLNFGVQGHTLEMEVAHLADRLDEINPAIVVLAFLADDLNTERADNHVDRYGYLTKNVFGAPSYWQDLVRAALRKSQLALLTKEAWLNLRAPSVAGPTFASDADAGLEPLLARFRASMKRFDELTAGRARMVMCLDITETPLTRSIRDVMQVEFPDLTYLHAPPLLQGLPRAQLLVPGDGHPNATAHRVYAELLASPVTAAAQSAVARSR